MFNKANASSESGSMAAMCCCIGSSGRGACDAGCKRRDSGDGGCGEEGALSLSHCDDVAEYDDEEDAAAGEENEEDEYDFVRGRAGTGADW